MLEVRDVAAGYDGVPALHGVSFEVGEGQIVAIVGSNGAGKTTTLRAVAGVLRPTAGTITFAAERIDRLPSHEVVARGIALIPEGRRLFARLSVVENLLLGAYLHRDPAERGATLGQVFDLFPVLRDRQDQVAGTLSGGEQQMLAIARGLMSRPRLLLLDEPSLGLMPTLVTRVMEVIREIRSRGLTVLLVEQDVRDALEMADRAYVLQTGRIVLAGPGPELLRSDLVRQAFLGM